MPFSSVVTRQGEVDAPHDSVVELAATKYPVIGEPWDVAEALHLTVADASPGVAVTLAGAVGSVAGRTDVVATVGPAPRPLVALTVKSYVVPFWSVYT